MRPPAAHLLLTRLESDLPKVMGGSGIAPGAQKDATWYVSLTSVDNAELG